MAGQSPAVKKSNKTALGCVVLVVLAFGGCTAWAVSTTHSDSPAASSTSSQDNNAPAPAAPATSAAASPAQRLADLDGDVNPVGDYQAALDTLAPKCTQDEAFIAGLGDSGYNDLVKNGVHDETRLTVLQHLDGSIPASLGKTDCTGMLSAYLVLREQG